MKRSAYSVFGWLAFLSMVGCASTPSSPPGAPEVPASLEEARGAYQRENYEKAQSILLNILRVEPRNAEAHELLSYIYWREGDEDRAIIGFERSLAIDHTNPQAAYNLGTLYLKRGEMLRAADLLEKAAELRPDHVATWINLGKAYFQLGLPEMSVASYERALELDPDNPDASASLEAIMLASENPTAKESAP